MLRRKDRCSCIAYDFRQGGTAEVSLEMWLLLAMQLFTLCTDTGAETINCEAIEFRLGTGLCNDARIDSAIKTLDKAIRFVPSDGIQYRNRYFRWPAKGDADKALTDYSHAILLNPHDSQAYCDRAQVYETKGRHDLAIADATTAIRLNPRLVGAYVTRGFSYLRLPKSKEAIK